MTEFNLQSMTGFGRAQGDSEFGQLSAELRTVNNRFQDISINLPRELGLLESALRMLLKQEIPRGKIDCRIRYTPAPARHSRVTINIALAREYLDQLKQLQEAGASGDIPINVLTTLPGVVEIAPADSDEQALWEALKGVVLQAGQALGAERAREGDALGRQLHDLGRQLRARVDEIDLHKSDIVKKYRERLTQRVAELEADIKTKLDPGRLEMEVALYADRADISEELTRLRAHLDRLDKLLQNEEGATQAGKNFDFLTQELGRETNTIASKVRDTTVAGMALEMKSIIERIREQTQNIQ